MGKSKKPNVKTKANTGKLNKPQTIPRRENKNKFRNIARWSEGYRSYGRYGQYSWHNGNYSTNTLPYRPKTHRKPPSRPVSPVLGSEEYMVRKIQQTSAIIMKQLLNPEEPLVGNDRQTVERNQGESSNSIYEQSTKICDKPSETVNKNKNKRINNYNIEEIQEKIMGHITNLNDGRKKNLINSHVSGYDEAIEQIQKQKRLEISRALRDMCSKPNETSSDFINSIIPDIGIKIEDIPRDLLEELRNTLNLDMDCGIAEDTGYYSVAECQTQRGNVLNTDNFMTEIIPLDNYIKPEPIDVDEPCSITADEEHSNKIKESVGRNSHDIDSDNMEITQPTLEIKSENILNNSLINETVCPVTSIKLEPVEAMDEHQTVVDDRLNYNNDKGDEHQKSDINNSENIATVPITSVKLEPLDEPHLVINDNEHQKSDINNSENIATVPITSVKLEPFDERHLVINDLVIDEKLNCNQSEGDASIGLICNEHYIGEDQESIDMSNYENVAARPVIAKQIDIRKPHVEISLPEPGVNLDSKKNYSYITADRDESKMGLENSERNQKNKLNNTMSVINDSSSSKKMNRATQTKKDDVTAERSIELFLEKYFNEPPKTVSEAIDRMLKMDQCILKLTTYRQSLFDNFKEKKKKKKTHNIPNTSPSKWPPKRKAGQQIRNQVEKKYIGVSENSKQETGCSSIKNVQKGNEQVERKAGQQIRNQVEKKYIGVSENSKHETGCSSIKNVQKGNEQVEPIECGTIPETITQSISLKFQDLQERILVLKLVEDKLVAASQNGKIYFCSLEDGHFSKVINISNVPITSLLFIKTSQDYFQMFVGSHEMNIIQFTIYKFERHCIEKNLFIDDDSAQCMENKWDYIFIGGSKGSLLRYSLKNKRMEYGDRFTNNSILVLKATQEGARRVLIIGSRTSPILIRDAMTGLHMRIMEYDSCGSPTVYSLILEKNLVYSGTTNHDILVFCFHDGRLMHRLKASNSKGITCMKVFKNLLFASCYNGSIYAYNLQDNTFINCIQGPGGAILSMEVLNDQLIVGTMSYKFRPVPIPHDILRHKLK